MGTHREGLLDDLATLVALLGGVARVDSDHFMSSILSFGREDIEKGAPRGVHDAFGKVVILHHVLNLQVLHTDVCIGRGYGFGNLEMEVPSLPLDLEVGFCLRTCGFAAALASLLAPFFRALLASERSLRETRETGIVNRLALAIGQEGLESHINADGRMRALRGQVFGWWFPFLFAGKGSETDDEGIPMSIRTMYQMGRFGSPFDGSMELDFDGASQLLWNHEMLAIRSKREIGFVLPELDRMPPVGCLETGKAHIGDT